MHLPIVQAAERNISVVGAALRYCLRFVTPATSFLFLVTVALQMGAVRWLPLPFSAQMPFGRRFIAVEEASNLTAAMGGIGLLICIVAAIATLDAQFRERRPLYWHFAIAWLGLLQHSLIVLPFEY